MQLSVRSNVDEVFRDLDAFANDAKTIAASRTLNTLLDQAEVAGKRAATENFELSRANMLKYGRFTYNRADNINQEATLETSGVAFPLWVFPHVVTGKGVNVRLHKQTFSFPHAFKIRGLGKVYARGSYSAAGSTQGFGSLLNETRALFRPTGKTHWGFRFGKGRFPISVLRTMSLPGIFGHPDVTEAMMERIEEQASKVMAREIRAIRRGF